MDGYRAGFTWAALGLLSGFFIGAGRASADTWQVSTQLTTAEFVRRGEAVHLERLSTGPLGWSPQPEAALPSAVETRGASMELTWSFDRAEVSGSGVVFHYRAQPVPLRASSEWTGGRRPGPILHRVTFINDSPDAVVFSPPPNLRLHVRPEMSPTLWWVEKGGMAPSEEGVFTEAVKPGFARRIASGPYSIDGPDRLAIPWCALEASGEGGLYVGIQTTAFTEIAVQADGTGSVALTAGLGRDGLPGRVGVHAGESRELSPCFVGTYSGSVEDGCHDLHAWILAHLRPPAEAPLPTLTFNTWGRQMRIAEDSVLELLDDAADMGVELVVVDAGWYAEVGDWRPHPERFPRGLRFLTESARERGLDLGLWVAWSHGGAVREAGDDALSVFNPDQAEWFTREYPADWTNRGWSGAPVCIAHSPAREWCSRLLHRLLEAGGMVYLKQDQRLVVEDCPRDGHGHLPGEAVDLTARGSDAYYAIYDRLLASHPGLRLEACCNGARMSDFGILARVHCIAAEDTYRPLTLRRAFYDQSYPYPPAMLEHFIGRFPPGDELHHFRYLLRSGMMGWCTIMHDTTRWSGEEKREARRLCDLYKRDLRPVIEGGKAWHVLPRPDGKQWDGMFLFNDRLGRGALFVFRPDCEQERLRVPLRGLTPSHRYRLSSHDGFLVETIASGRELMRTGVEVVLPERHSSDVIMLDRLPETENEKGAVEP